MDARSYKDIRARSGHTYHTFVAPPRDASKLTLLFVHGFPSTAHDWRHQVAFFLRAGYGVVAPDLLGHGGSDKPAHLKYYAPSSICADLVDILGQAKVGRAVAVGHDWGSIVTSRLASYYRERFAGFAFLSGGYYPSLAGFQIKDAIEHNVKHFKAELFGYWLFLAEDHAKDIVNAHLESMQSIWYAADPGLWKTVLSPPGPLKAWLLANKKAPLAPYITPDEKARMLAEWGKTGLGPALNWFKVFSSGLMSEDDKAVKPEWMRLDHPVYFAACARDHVCLAEPSALIVRQFCTKATVETFDTGHWVQLEQPEKLNRALLAWLEKAVGK
ncbi:alpha/beta-hydrolase [Trametes versicolor FP-101664 SS1]|uniref:alpha/beta-hydrolase n=1 Tax=Trametes versicolor (strain FP-101664) TaxID=717944 RepID=UPI00046244A7|nr:alpha/beta-hydrolase [Trametes versicolor FP-101664 SS1]EIW61342.1 alpha/beta-hydrolase [Trametes versicolor FP-101664 SS1]